MIEEPAFDIDVDDDAIAKSLYKVSSLASQHMNQQENKNRLLKIEQDDYDTLLGGEIKEYEVEIPNLFDIDVLRQMLVESIKDMGPAKKGLVLKQIPRNASQIYPYHAWCLTSGTYEKDTGMLGENKTAKLLLRKTDFSISDYTSIRGPVIITSQDDMLFTTKELGFLSSWAKTIKLLITEKKNSETDAENLAATAKKGKSRIGPVNSKTTGKPATQKRKPCKQKGTSTEKKSTPKKRVKK